MTNEWHDDTPLARQTLTDTQFLTWFMHQRGCSHRTIAAYRHVSPSTVRDCLDACHRLIEKAKNEAA